MKYVIEKYVFSYLTPRCDPILKNVDVKVNNEENPH